MSRMISMCGLTCSDCGAFKAKRADDQPLREKTAAEWSKLYGSEIKAADINCDGCVSAAGVHFNYCSTCEIRKCGLGRKLANCAACPEYACDKLQKFFKMVPDAERTLAEIRVSRS
jgi:hypothetical protein